jgi:nicotinamidase-related amidase
MQRRTRSMSYSELKITGPPLYGQGKIDPSSSSSSSSKDGDVKGRSSSICFPSLDASKTALLLVDIQPEYWSNCPAVRQDFPQFPQNVERLLQHCRSEENCAKIVWVRADYSYEKSPWLMQFSRIHQGRIPPIVQPSSEWETFATPLENEHVMTKSSWSSTSQTELLDVLRSSGIDTVLVCGLITSVCVQHSAFGVFEAGFRTILITDACADR